VIFLGAFIASLTEPSCILETSISISSPISKVSPFFLVITSI